MGLVSTAEFHAVLASAVHELKNSLSNVNRLIQDLSELYPESNQEKLLLEYETNRMNNYLSQLLVLYKIEADAFKPRIDEHLAEDIILDVLAVQEALCSVNKLTLHSSCDENLLCYCDNDLVTNALNTLIQNAQRYAIAHIKISASFQEGYVVFCVEDDGPGIPEKLLQDAHLLKNATDLKNNNFGLGLYFVSTIAQMHKNSSKTGQLRMDNLSELGGARISLFIP